MKRKLITTLISGLCLFVTAGISHASIVSGGLVGQYYNDATTSAPSWNNFQYSQVDPTVNFNWGTGSPNTGLLGNDGYSIRWTGWVLASTAGTYSFQTTSDDSSMLYIDGTTVVNNEGNHASRTRSGSISLSAGLHALELTYHEWTGSANVTLSWNRGQGSSYYVIDADHLYYENGINPVPLPPALLLFAPGLAVLTVIRRRFVK